MNPPLPGGATGQSSLFAEGMANIELRVDKCAGAVEPDTDAKQAAKQEAAFVLAQAVGVQGVHTVESDLVSGSHPAPKIQIPYES